MWTLYYKNRSSTGGLLTSFFKMRVDLAAQIQAACNNMEDNVCRSLVTRC
jgi:hypothetical protein